jgi:hypothetical protein
MFALWLALVTTPPAQPVGVHIEDVQGLSAEVAQELARGIAKSVEELTGASVVLDDQLWESECTKPDRCASEIRGRTGAGQVVLLKAFAAATRLRLVADLSDRESKIVHSVQADLGREPESWPGTLRGFAQILFPTAAGAPTQVSVVAAPAPEPPSRTFSWVAIGAGVGSLGAAVALRLAANAQHDNYKNSTTAAQADAAMNATIVDGTASNLLFGAAAVLVASAVVWWVSH